MRSIKFRMWDGKEFLYNLAKFNNNELFVENDPMKGIVKFNKPVLDVQQFTGLYDVNGKEIWEGDILSEFIEDKEGNYFRQSTVIFYDGIFTTDHDERDPLNQISTNWMEVVGNIYEKTSSE